MRNLIKGVVSASLLAAFFALGCGASNGDTTGTAGTSGTAGTGDFGTAGTGDVAGDGGGGTAGAAPTLLSSGQSCFDVVSVAAGAADGCMLGVDQSAPDGVVGAALLVNFDPTTGILTVGTEGSLGTGTVTDNMATLARENTPALADMPSCTHHQTDMSNVTVTAQDELDLSAVETQDMFADACSAANVPTGGMCTSTWTWHMVKGTKTPPGCD